MERRSWKVPKDEVQEFGPMQSSTVTQNMLKTTWRLWDPSIFLKDNMSVVIMILNQPMAPNVQEFVKRNWNSAVLRIAVDGGLIELEKIPNCDKTLVPDIICGDFDSVSPAILDHYGKLGSKVTCTDDQDETDFTKALRIVREALSMKSMKVNGVLAISQNGDRLDHIIGNLNTLYLAATFCPVPVFIVGNNSLAWLMEAGQHKVVVCKEMLDAHVGLIPLGEPCKNITTTGLAWNLTNGSMNFGGLISICNRFDGSPFVTVQNDQAIIWTMEFTL